MLSWNICIFKCTDPCAEFLVSVHHIGGEHPLKSWPLNCCLLGSRPNVISSSLKPYVLQSSSKGSTQRSQMNFACLREVKCHPWPLLERLKWTAFPWKVQECCGVSGCSRLFAPGWDHWAQPCLRTAHFYPNITYWNEPVFKWPFIFLETAGEGVTTDLFQTECMTVKWENCIFFITWGKSICAALEISFKLDFC